MSNTSCAVMLHTRSAPAGFASGSSGIGSSGGPIRTVERSFAEIMSMLGLLTCARSETQPTEEQVRGEVGTDPDTGAGLPPTGQSEPGDSLEPGVPLSEGLLGLGRGAWTFLLGLLNSTGDVGRQIVQSDVASAKVMPVPEVGDRATVVVGGVHPARIIVEPNRRPIDAASEVRCPVREALETSQAGSAGGTAVDHNPRLRQDVTVAKGAEVVEVGLSQAGDDDTWLPPLVDCARSPATRACLTDTSGSGETDPRNGLAGDYKSARGAGKGGKDGDTPLVGTSRGPGETSHHADTTKGFRIALRLEPGTPHDRVMGGAGDQRDPTFSDMSGMKGVDMGACSVLRSGPSGCVHTARQGVGPSFPELSPQLKADLADTVVRFATMSLRDRESAEVSINLRPEHLGEVKIRLSLEGRTLSAFFSVTNGTTRELVEGALPLLREALNLNGLSVGGLSVFVDDRSAGGYPPRPERGFGAAEPPIARIEETRRPGERRGPEVMLYPECSFECVI